MQIWCGSCKFKALLCSDHKDYACFKFMRILRSLHVDLCTIYAYALQVLCGYYAFSCKYFAQIYANLCNLTPHPVEDRSWLSIVPLQSEGIGPSLSLCKNTPCTPRDRSVEVQSNQRAKLWQFCRRSGILESTPQSLTMPAVTGPVCPATI
jgi:hypothetical protein